MPFVTEALWQALPHNGPSLMVAPWPQEGWVDEHAEALLGSLMDLVRGIRYVRAEYDLPAGKRIPAVIVAGDKAAFLNEHREVLCALAHLDRDALQISEARAEKPMQALTVVEGGVEAYLPLAGVIDIEAEQQRIAEEMESLTKRIGDLEIRLRNENFLTKAPEEVVERERQRRDEARERWVRLRDRLHQLDTL
jgi:valyl-tRNA synthetase